MNDIMHDIIIIGGGPAGLTAAIYAAREMLGTLLLEKNMCGGAPATVELIENYPGFPDGISGTELMDRLKKQAQRFGTRITEFKEIKKVEPADGRIKVRINDETYSGLAVIAASGSIPKKLDIPGEEKYTGKGVSYCATCDGPLYKGRSIAVVGGGNAACEEALFLTKFGREVILIHRRNELRAAKILQEKLKESKNLKLLLNHKPISINGEYNVNSITVEDCQTNKKEDIEVSGVFIYIGALPNSKFLEGIVELDDAGYIKTDEKMQTSTPGIYAVGDVRSKDIRQIIVACGEAAVAAISVRDYLKKIKA